MSWSVQAVIMVCEMVLGYFLGRVLIPCFRKTKTGKFDIYIGDRFAKDGSEPKFGGVIIMMCVIIGIVIGLMFDGDTQTLSFSAGYSKRMALISLGAVIMLTAIGVSEDYVKEKKLGIGMKPIYKLLMEYLICLGLCVCLKPYGGVSTAVLMPFHLGYIEFGKSFYVLFPLFMTIGINAVKIHDCAGGRTDTGVDGLCAVTALVFSAGLSSGFAATSSADTAQLFAVVTMGAAAGFLFWGCDPAKLYLGESGALALGSLMTVSVLLSGLHLVFILAGAAAIIDGICALLQYAAFKTRKKLLFKGYTLHEHLMKKGWGAFKILGADAAVSALGSAAAIMFIVYASKISM
ncbi:hypothetical protein [Ruminococcus sp.]|uniref:hypothetical protein n=1 Tax=Ruminococcus sp. TaxID=41978 RepID=UPI0025F46BE7|nr:hypothetical protein [Ruminococcus sp.]